MKCWCRHCGKELEVGHSGACPDCGRAGKDCEVVSSVVVGVRAISFMRQKRKGFNKFIREAWSRRWKSSGDPKLPKGVYEDRAIDKERDTYDQLTRDVETGRVTHEHHEPLSKHRSAARTGNSQSE